MGAIRQDELESAAAGIAEPLIKRSPHSEVAEYTARAKSGFFWLCSTTAAWQTISWFLTLITARLLTPHDYGLLAMNEAVAPYLLMIASFKMESWIVQRERYSEQDERALFTLSFIFGLTASLAAFFAAPLLGRFYSEPKVIQPFQAVSLIFVLRALHVAPSARLARELRFAPVAVGNLTVGVLRGILQLGLAFLGFGYWSLVAGVIFSEVGGLIWVVFAAGMPTGFGWDPALYKGALKYGAAATASTVFWIIFSTADNLLVGRLFGADVLGYYAMAFYLADLPLSKLNTVIGPLLVPFFSRLKVDRTAAAGSFLKINKSIISIVAPTLLGIAGTAGEIVPLLLGDQWIPLVGVLRVMCVIGVWRAMTASASSLLLAHNRPRELLRWSGLNALVLPLCFYLLGGHYGLPGIYASWLLVYPVTGVILLLHVLAPVIFVEPFRFLANIRAPIVSAMLMCAGVLVVGGIVEGVSIWVVLAAKVSGGLILYPLFFRLFFPGDFFDTVRQLKGLVARSAPEQA